MIRHRIAIATSDEFPELIDDDLRLAEPLARAGIAWAPAIWTDPGVDWRAFDAVVIRTTWDYFERLSAFKAWLERLEALPVKVLNPVSTMLVNADKTYLKDLAASGVKTIPTAWIDRGASASALRAALAALPWDEVVIKPSVSAGAYRTERTTAAALRADPTLAEEIVGDAHALIQPFMPEVLSAGEWSFLFFGDEFSHAVVKKPKAGDYRVQWTHGGRHEKAEPAAAVLAQATAAFKASKDLAGSGADRLYTRVDGIVRGGDFFVIEVELIEPYLFFEEDQAAPERFVGALAALL